MILPHRKEFIHMKTAHDMTECCTATADERQMIIDKIRAILPSLTREQKEALLERLKALAEEEAAD